MRWLLLSTFVSLRIGGRGIKEERFTSVNWGTEIERLDPLPPRTGVSSVSVSESWNRDIVHWSSCGVQQVDEVYSPLTGRCQLYM
jgi:hypothetical protein